MDDDLDFRTFRVGDFGFGYVFVDVPDNRTFYQTTIDLTEDLNILVDVIAGIDITTGEAFWEFTSVDPETGELPLDAFEVMIGDRKIYFSAEAYNIKPDGTLCFCIDAEGLPTLLGIKPSYHFYKRPDNSVYY